MKVIGDRMKENYENRYRYKLLRRTPVIIRLDGKAFHTLTKKCEKPFDENFNSCMTETATMLIENVQGCKIAYTQSDEISLLLTDFDDLKTEAWFDYNIQKMTSISSGFASSFFSSKFGRFGIFDSRVFNIPKEEVCNYFIWRQKDWERNSIQMLSQAHYSSKQLHKKNTSDMHDMLNEKGVNWQKLEDKWKNGTAILKKEREYTRFFGIFKDNRYIIEQFLSQE